MTFAHGANLGDPCGQFNASLEGTTRRAIDFHENEEIDANALKSLYLAAVALNEGVKKRKWPRRRSPSHRGISAPTILLGSVDSCDIDAHLISPYRRPP